MTIVLEKLKEIMDKKLSATLDMNGKPIVIGIDNVLVELECVNQE